MKVQEWKITVVQSNPQLIRHVQMAGDTELSMIRKLIRCVFYMQNEITGKVRTVSALNSLPVWEDISEKTTSQELADQSGCWIIQGGFSLNFTFRMELISEREVEKFELPRVSRARGTNLPDRYCDSAAALNEILSSWEYNHYYFNNRMGYIRKSDCDYDSVKVQREIRKIYAPETVPKEINWDVTLRYESLLDLLSVSQLKQMAVKNNIYVGRSSDKYYLTRELALELCSEENISDYLYAMEPEEYELLTKILCEKSPAIKQSLPDAFPVLSSDKMIAIDRGKIYVAKEVGIHVQALEESELPPTHLNYLRYLQILRACLVYLVIFTKEDVRRIWSACYPKEAEAFEVLWSGEYTDDPEYFIRDMQYLTDDIVYNGDVLDEETAEIASESPILMTRECDIPKLEELRRLSRGSLFTQQVENQLTRMIMDELPYVGHLAREYIRRVACMLNMGVEDEKIIQYLTDEVGMSKRFGRFNDLMKVIRKNRKYVRQAPLRGYTEIEFRKMKGEV